MSITIRDLMTDPELFGDQFGGESWAAWRALLAGFYGLKLAKQETAIFSSLTGLSEPPGKPLDELWLAVGRRGGKSQIAALLAVFEAAFRTHGSRLAPGEMATVRVMAADRAQARVVMRYVSGLLSQNPMLYRLVVREDRETIELSNRCVLEVGTASFRTSRGFSFCAVIADEIAFWRSDESANPDVEILNAVRPGMATLDGKLIALSSPYSKHGALWNTFKRCFGKEGPVLVAQAGSRIMNPLLSERVVNQAMEDDPAAARAEYMAQFRDDLEQFLERAVIDAAIRPGPLELPFNRECKYAAFTDPAGGGQDEFTLSIGHREKDRIIVDLLRARKGTPASIVAEYAVTIKSFGLHAVTGDKYGGSWPADEFSRCGITYRPSEKAKSDLYLDLLPALNSGRVELPPDDKLINQLANLERRTARSGKDSIDHPQGPGGHDDRANVVAGLVSIREYRPVAAMFGVYGNHLDNTRRGYHMNEFTGSRLGGTQSGHRERETKSFLLSDGSVVHL